MDWEEWQRKRSDSEKNKAGQNKGFNQDNNFDINDLLKKFNKNSFKLPIVPIIIAIVGIWLLSGFFTVQPFEVGLIKRFGAYQRSAEQGLNYHLPYPLETVIKVDVSQVRRFEIGASKNGATDRGVMDEGMMLTKDENIVDIKFVVQYKVNDPQAYAFNILDPEQVIKDAATSAMREVIGSETLDGALTQQRQKIQEETRKVIELMMVKYNSGLLVDTVELQAVQVPSGVSTAFKDVTSAKEDKVKSTNEATGYRNKVIPEAQGEAAVIIAQANAYKAEKVNVAEGEALKFKALLSAYKQSPEVTKKRLYIEQMEKIYPDANKVLMGKDINSLLPHLGLNQTKP